MKDFDVIIVGGGHAGVEAALAVARMGLTAAIITMDAKRLALMSCNPAIGGIGKSHLVKEIEALGGVMGKATDATGIQFRRLNLSRGPAVWSTRVQCDRRRYNEYIVDYVAAQKNVSVVESLAGAILVEDGITAGIRTEDGRVITSSAVIIATGTFLGGLIHIGEKKIKAGRIGENAAYKMSESLDAIGFTLGRLKTGTPPRLDGKTIDWSRCEIQPGEEPIPFFSRSSQRGAFAQTPCYLTYTSEKTKEIIMANLHRSPMFSGQIQSTGPRYCPSVEDKFFRFADKAAHQLFLEPEGDGTDDIYPNGFSTSLPEEVQHDAIRTVIGLEEVIITRPGYAVEYDYCPTHQITPSLETRLLPGLFFAGQINGTSGYEEAAGQGIIAGINAALKIKNEPPLILDRSEAYIGVMIDDLVTRSTTEPYRLFTSRAEYRLALREDNAIDRLTEYANQYGLISDEEYRDRTTLFNATEASIKSLRKQRVPLAEFPEIIQRFKQPEANIGVEKLLTQPEMNIDQAMPVLQALLSEVSTEALERAAIQIRYRGYVEKQDREIQKFKQMERDLIPSGFSFENIKGLKKEAWEKFQRFQPASIGQAGRIEGITPADVAVLSVYIKRHKVASSQV